MITPCPRLRQIKNGAAFLRFNLRNDCWFTVNQLRYSVFSEGEKDCRLIWLIFHKAYKGRGHLRLFRLFVLSQYCAPRLSRRAAKSTALEHNAKTRHLPMKVFICDSVVCEMGAVQTHCSFSFRREPIQRGQFARDVLSLSRALITANRFVLISSPVLFDIS